jgi:hypothetical protein
MYKKSSSVLSSFFSLYLFRKAPTELALSVVTENSTASVTISAATVNHRAKRGLVQSLLLSDLDLDGHTVTHRNRTAFDQKANGHEVQLNSIRSSLSVRRDGVCLEKNSLCHFFIRPFLVDPF